MPLLNILQQIKRKGQIQRTTPPLAQPSRPVQSSPRATTPNLATSERPVDPVVARLKAARKAEREKKEAEARAKKGQAPKKETKPRAPKQALRLKVPSRESSKGPTVAPPPVSREKKPKVSFSQLMKKASLIDQSKLSIQLKNKTKSPEPRPERRKVEAKARPAGHVNRDKRPHTAPKEKPRAPPREPPSTARAPIPARRPNLKLEERLQQKKPVGQGHEDDEGDDSDLGSFIASDEEEDVPQDYDRDEIWAMFNKGRTRQYNYDSDSDDMEATGAEIFEEEARSKKRALEEDRREMEEEQRLAELKKRRKARA